MSPIADLAEINPTAPRSTLVDRWRQVSFLPMSSVSEGGQVIQEIERTLGEVARGYSYFERGDVVVAKITPCMENGKAAHLSELRHPCGFGSTEFHVLRPRQGVDGRYLFHAVWNPRFRLSASRSMTGSAGQKRVPAEFLKRYRIPAPPLAEQKRIAAILDKADEIRRKRQQAVALSHELTRSAFLEIVGPKAEDYAGWPRVRIEGLAARPEGSIRSGPFGSALRHSEFVSSGVAVLGIDNAVNNRFEWAERRYITQEKFAELERYKVYPGDVLITLMGTTGRSAVVPDNIPTSITTKHLATITVDRAAVEPEVLSHAIHIHPEVLRQVAGSNRGAIMAGLNLGIIKQIELPLPPMNLQRRFVRAIVRIRALQDKMKSAPSADLIDCLSQRAFDGEI